MLGHGAGADQHSPFMIGFARALASRGLDVVTFNFLYTERRRRLPDRAPALEGCYLAVIGAVREQVDSARHALFIGGKSMGGRIATQVAAADAALPLAGLVLLGYPLHPPGRPDRLRDAHLPAVARSDALRSGHARRFRHARRAETDSRRVTPAPTLHEVSGGDHSFKLAAATRPGRPRCTRRFRVPSSSGSRSRPVERVGGDQELLDDPSDDEMLLDDAFEDRRIAAAVPRAFRIDDGDRAAFADAQAVRLRPQDAALVGETEFLQALSSGSPRPRRRGPCRSTSASSDRRTERCAAARPARRWSRRFPARCSTSRFLPPPMRFCADGKSIDIMREAY